MNPSMTPRRPRIRAALACFGGVLAASALASVVACEGVLDGLTGGPAASNEGGSDARTDADAGGVVVQPCPDAAFCDDFESGNLGKWTTVDPGPLITVTVDDRAPHRGHDALHLVAPMGDGGITYAEVQHRLSSAKTSGTISLRAWVLVHETLPDDTAFIVFRPPDAPFPSIAFLSTQGRLTYFISDATGSGPGNGGPVTVALGVDAYVCLSVTVTVGTAGHLLATVGGTTAADVDIDTLSGSPGIGVAGIGLPTLTTSRPSEIFFDDVAISETEPLPCPP